MYKFLGIQRLDFTPRGSNDHIQGYKVHFLDMTANQFIVGGQPFSVFMSDDRFLQLFPGGMAAYANRSLGDVDVVFGRQNRLEQVRFAK